MEEKTATKISLSTFLLIIAIIAIIVMGIFIYKLNNDKTAEIQKSTELQSQVNSLNGTVSDLQEKINKISNTIIDDTTNTSKNADKSNSDNDIALDLEISYITYSKNGIEFKYPSTFKQTSDTFNTSGFEAIEDYNKNRFQIQSETISNSNSLKDIVKREKELTMPDGTNYRSIEKNEEYITLPNGIKGYRFESKTNDNAYQIMFITQNNNKAYQFTYTIENKANYNDYIGTVNKILDSLTIK